MKGWTGNILRVDLSKEKYSIQKYDGKFAFDYMGGRGLAVKILWDEVIGVDPLSPENEIVFSAGPLTGLPIPSSGKLVVASKSPLTYGYGDGNVGTRASLHMRKAGYDAIVIKGALRKPKYLYVEDGKVEFNPADDLWGCGVFKSEKKLEEIHGKNCGILLIGQAGENMVRFAIIRSEEGRAGGRPGMGAVMGSKKLKAIVIKGNGKVDVYDEEGLRKLGREGYDNIKGRPNYDFWIRQGTMAVHEWCQENSVLPTFNFKEGVFDFASEIDGNSMEGMKVDRFGCPNCNMRCGNAIRDERDRITELDYENVGMLGSNIGLSDLRKVATLNWMADDFGLDTISLGNVIGFVMESSEKGVLKDYRIEWGDFDKAKELTRLIAYREGVGNLLAEGTKRISEMLGQNSSEWAMQIKGLEISAYDCHYAPAMALSYGTSPIGAHHKDAWVISWEIKVGRGSYSKDKVDKVIEFQRIRGGIFESIVVCRLPWIELGFELEWYLKYLKAATGLSFSLKDLFEVSDRIYNLMRAYWIREYDGRWDRKMDLPPPRWFKEPLTKGPFAGKCLDMDGYNRMLSYYYRKRGWDEQGIPKRETLDALGLNYVSLPK
ncbi:MAG: aldehyde ferredoxin oxidoreductase family protein [Candidatus Asgardarchaeia archaeon]